MSEGALDTEELPNAVLGLLAVQRWPCWDSLWRRAVNLRR